MKRENIIVKVIHPVPSFICPIRFINVKSMGKNEEVELPERVAELLIRKKRAREVVNPFAKWERKDVNTKGKAQHKKLSKS